MNFLTLQLNHVFGHQSHRIRFCSFLVKLYIFLLSLQLHLIHNDQISKLEDKSNYSNMFCLDPNGIRFWCSSHLSLFYFKLGLGQRWKVVDIFLLYMLSKVYVQIVNGFLETSQILDNVWAGNWLQARRFVTSSWPIISFIWALIIHSHLWRIESDFLRPKNQPKISFGLRDMSDLRNLHHKHLFISLKLKLILRLFLGEIGLNSP